MAKFKQACFAHDLSKKLAYNFLLYLPFCLALYSNKSTTILKCNHLYFHTSSEPPLFKGDSRDVKNKK